MSKRVRAGDLVYHRPTKEKWVVAAVSPDGTELVCCGWPETIAKIADCEVVETRRASDDDHTTMLLDVAKSCPDQLRGSWARQELAKKESPRE